ncbi:MAG: flavodoxin [Campylobacterota bacterium]|nr:flavodoxin [Campylobacterota bacterium]
MAIGIFYGSNGGATESAAEKIKEVLDLDANLHDIADIKMEKFGEYTEIIIGVSTWGEGELQDDWDECFDEFKELDFSGKTVAFFGLGDQDGYEDNFLDAMGILHDAAVEKGANIVGNGWPTDGYEYEESVAVQDGAFVGLGLDEDNQYDETDDRIAKWVEIIKPSMSA